MATIAIPTWVANAAAVLTGAWGDVTRRAQQRGCSRQALYDQARKVHDAVAAAHDGGPSRAELSAEAERLRRENAALGAWLEQTIDFPEPKRQRFAVTAAALGLSLEQIRTLLAIVLGDRATPSRATLGRTVRAAGRAAGRVLQRLDDRCKELILVACLDEVFLGRGPTLVGIAPASQVWFLGQRAADRSGARWAAALAPWSGLQFVRADGGSGVRAGITAVDNSRRAAGRPPLGRGLDLFHLKREGQRVLNQAWRRLEGLWGQAETAAARAAAAEHRGDPKQRLTQAALARRRWDQVEAAFRAYARQERAWRQVEAALVVLRPDGRPQDRATAEAELAAAVPGLWDRPWGRVRRWLQDPACLAYLDRLHAQLEQAEPEPRRRAELVRLWWLRRHRPRDRPRRGRAAPAVGAGHVAHLVQQVVCRRLDPSWPAAYRLVATALRQAVRASSAVEGLNSVLRMHQGRHRRMTQGLLDLKRLYWNCHRFREGRRRRRRPYELLGLQLPAEPFWSLLAPELAAAT